MTDSTTPTDDRKSEPDAAPTLPFFSAPEAHPMSDSTVPAPAPAPAPATTPRRPLFGTILWGTLVLAFAGFVVFRTLDPGSADPSLWLLGGVIAMGLVLVVAGVAAAVRHTP